jgi:hypothetical protein
MSMLSSSGAAVLHAQTEGLWEGYDGEWGHVRGNNEHMGQLVAYARINGIVPPWSEARK